MIMTQEQRDTIRKRQKEGYLKQTFTANPSVAIYRDTDGLTVYEHHEPINTNDLKELAEKIFFLHKPSSKDIEKCLKTYIGKIKS